MNNLNLPMNQRGRHGPWQLPQNWRAIESDAGELLYIERICGRYWARFECGQWWAYANADGPMSGERIGHGPTRDHALLTAREHMHAQESA